MKKLSLAGILALSTAILATTLLPAKSQAATYPTGTILRCPPSYRVDYTASNGKKYTFPNAYIFSGWGYTANSAVTVACADFNSVPTGIEMITARPGSLVKFDNRAEIYAVTRAATLRHVTTPTLLRQIFGARPRIIPLFPNDFSSYRVGTPIIAASDFNVVNERTAGGTINDELTARGVIGTIVTPPPVEQSTDAALVSLTENASTNFAEAISPDTLNYTLTVPNATQNVTLTATSRHAAATMTVNGQTVARGQGVTAGLQVGANTVRIVVTAENRTTQRTYTVTITRQAAPVLSANANVGFLTLRSPDGTFSAGIPTPAQQINQTVANSVAQLQVEPLVYDNATVTVNGQPMPNVLPPNHYVAVPLNVGANTITIVVTAQDGTRKTYTVSVTRQAPPVVLSTDAALLSLAENATTNFAEEFAVDRLNYTMTVPNGTTHIAFTPTTRHAAATVTVNGQAVARGQQSANQALLVGTNIVTIVVTAEDTSTRRIYSVTITREAAPTGGTTVENIITRQVFSQLFPNIGNPGCNGSGIFTYDNFIEATRSFPLFGAEGSDEIRKREIAAFLANTSQETTGAPVGGPYSWGYCFKEELACTAGQCVAHYCDPNSQFRCVSGKSYHGRGPMQLSWNYNYGQAGQALGLNLLENPDLLTTNGVVSFKTALWFWMTAQPPKPSAHNVMVGNWQPTAQDLAWNRLPGFGMTINIINGGIECMIPTHSKIRGRVGYFTRYTQLLGTTTGDNLYCDQMKHYRDGR